MKQTIESFIYFLANEVQWHVDNPNTYQKSIMKKLMSKSLEGDKEHESQEVIPTVNLEEPDAMDPMRWERPLPVSEKSIMTSRFGSAGINFVQWVLELRVAGYSEVASKILDEVMVQALELRQSVMRKMKILFTLPAKRIATQLRVLESLNLEHVLKAISWLIEYMARIIWRSEETRARGIFVKCYPLLVLRKLCPCRISADWLTKLQQFEIELQSEQSIFSTHEIGFLDIEESFLLENSPTSKVQLFPCVDGSRLPMSVPYMDEKFYVRDCYPTYYDYILNVIKEEPPGCTISVTGTPGIGKSMFYNYFFERYRREHPKKPIVTASFTIFRDYRNHRLFLGEMAGEISVLPIPQVEDAIHLYDGPAISSLQNRTLICFTGRNAAWFDVMRKNGNHTVLYMPPWSLPELLDARSVLDLDIAPARITKRFELFGGSARYCLCDEKSFHKNAEKNLLGKLHTLRTLADIELLLQDQLDVVLTRSVFHFIPKYFEQYPDFFTLGLGSSEVQKRLEGIIERTNVEGRRFFAKCIKGNPYAPGLLVWMFEFCTRSSFECGGAWDMVSLETPSMEHVELQIPANCYIRSPQGSAVDGHYYKENDTLYLFQMRIAATDSILNKGKALTYPIAESEIQKYIGGLENDHFGITKLILARHLNLVVVFVTPQDTLKLTRQEIVPFTLPHLDEKNMNLKRKNENCMDLTETEWGLSDRIEQYLIEIDGFYDSPRRS